MSETAAQPPLLSGRYKGDAPTLAGGNPDVIKAAELIVDLGVEGVNKGDEIIDRDAVVTGRKLFGWNNGPYLKGVSNNDGR